MSAVKNYTAKQLLDRVKQVSGYKSIPTGFWLLGVRSNEDLPNVFDDKIYFFEGERFICVTSATTNPGTTVLRSFERFNAKGAAVLVADQWYYNVWTRGMHQGKVPGLLQLGSRVKVWRDNNKNDKSGDTGEIQEGFFGINFHPNTHDFNAKTTGTLVNGWSAGCQVVNNMERYRQIINTIPTKTWVSYCLLNEF